MPQWDSQQVHLIQLPTRAGEWTITACRSAGSGARILARNSFTAARLYRSRCCSGSTPRRLRLAGRPSWRHPAVRAPPHSWFGSRRHATPIATASEQASVHTEMPMMVSVCPTGGWQQSLTPQVLHPTASFGWWVTTMTTPWSGGASASAPPASSVSHSPD